MKVILHEDVPRVGKAGEVVNVAPGYYRNFLNPRDIAVKATPQALKQFEQRKKTLEKIEGKEKEEAQKLAEELKDVTIKIEMRAGESDRLFGSVTTSDIAEKLLKKGYEVDRKQIHLSEPIKSLGEFDIEIKVHSEVTATIKLIVEKAE